jgi:hypothetical protein
MTIHPVGSQWALFHGPDLLLTFDRECDALAWKHDLELLPRHAVDALIDLFLRAASRREHT